MTRRIDLIVLGLCTLFSGCGVLVQDLFEDKKPDYIEEEPGDGYSLSEIRSRIVTDVRLRELREQVDLGKQECKDLEFLPEGVLCREHQEPVWVVDFADPSGKGEKGEEKAYVCKEDRIYWYCWNGKEGRRWLGPFPSGLRKKEEGKE